MAWNDFITKDYLVKNVKSCDALLDKNKALALKLGVKGTPTLFFSNGTKAVGVLKAKEIEQRFLDASFYSD
jgi:thiol:disulfide interchange protein DsbC